MSKKRLEAYRSAPPLVQSLYANPKLGIFLGGIVQDLSLSEESRLSLINSVGDVILKFIPLTSLSEKLHTEIDIPPQTAELVAEKLGQIIKEANEKSETEIPPKDTQQVIPAVTSIPVRERLDLRPSGAPEGAPAPQGAPVVSGPRPLTRDEVLSALAPKHTMQDDITAQGQAGTPPRTYGGFHSGNTPTQQ